MNTSCEIDNITQKIDVKMVQVHAPPPPTPSATTQARPPPPPSVDLNPRRIPSSPLAPSAAVTPTRFTKSNQFYLHIAQKQIQSLGIFFKADYFITQLRHSELKWKGYVPRLISPPPTYKCMCPRRAYDGPVFIFVSFSTVTYF